METYADLIGCEDVLLFANAAITSTGQREFHSAAGKQRLSLAFLHSYIHGNYPDLYAATLALDVNDHNAALIIANLLRRKGGHQGDGRLIAWRLARMSPPRVYRLFQELRRAGVNNRRTRALVRDWLAARPYLAFDAVKYRSAVKPAVRHAHLSPRAEDACTGAEVRGLDDALKVFEIYPGQCGLLLYAGTRWPARSWCRTRRATGRCRPARRGRAPRARMGRLPRLGHGGRAAARSREGGEGLPDGPVHAEPVPAVVRAEEREPHR
jgi:hypothetical protein